MNRPFSHRSRERGAINFGCVFGGFVLLVAVYLAVKFLPVKIGIAELRDTVTSEATMASIKKDGDIRFAIMNKVRELKWEMYIKEDDIQMTRTAENFAARFDVVIPVDLVGGKTYMYREVIDVKRQLF